MRHSGEYPMNPYGEYRKLGSNQWPQGYEPRALPLRHPG